MSHRILALTGALTAVAMLVLLAPSSVAGQQAPAATTNWTVGRTPWGDPDLQGVYTFATQTPLQRPKELGGKAAYTEAELAELAQRAAAARRAREARALDPSAPSGGYDAVWTATERGTLSGRTSLIIDPEDGRMPALTPQAQKIRADIEAEEASRSIGPELLYNTWADHPTYTRCLSRPMPRIGQAYNHGLQILQTPGQVVVHYESMHDVRVIPLDGRPHLPQSIRQLNGDSRGHWEGNTLVVDWTNFSDKQRFDGAGDGETGLPQGNMRYTERFTKVDANTIEYVVTVEDPTTYARPWTIVLPWKADDPNYQNPEDLYEFACHEGNYRMMEDSLSGSRALKEAQSSK
jgi:hypothetical protein